MIEYIEFTDRMVLKLRKYQQSFLTRYLDINVFKNYLFYSIFVTEIIQPFILNHI